MGKKKKRHYINLNSKIHVSLGLISLLHLTLPLTHLANSVAPHLTPSFKMRGIPTKITSKYVPFISTFQSAEPLPHKYLCADPISSFKCQTRYKHSIFLKRACYYLHWKKKKCSRTKYVFSAKEHITTQGQQSSQL